MPERTYSVIELVGTSEHGIDEAIQNAITRAAQTLKGLDWFEVISTRGQIGEGSVRHYQVTMKVGFRVLDAADRTAATAAGTPVIQAAPRAGSGTTNRVVEDAVMGPAETALEEVGERPLQTAAERLGGQDTLAGST